MKIEEAIEWMEEAVQETTECFEQCSPSLQKELVMQKEVFELAITALRSMQEAGEPLRLEQLREVPHGKIKDSTLQNIANRANEIASPPAHIDRSKWEACDHCKKACWNCNHNLFAVKEMTKCDDCVNQSKWEFLAYQNYCPKCGRPLTEEAWVELERRVMR